MMRQILKDRQIKPWCLCCSHAAICFVLATALALYVSMPAWGIVEPDDVILGESIESSGWNTEQCPSIDASHAALLSKDGTLVFGRRASEPTQIASLTKIMTAIVAADYLGANDVVTMTPQASSVGESSAGLMQGDTMTFDAALKALLTASGNDAACAIAEAVGALLLGEQEGAVDSDECVAAFVQAMNDKATAIGLTGSYFTNPHGLDYDEYAQGQFSCAQDVATMLYFALKSDLIRANIGYSRTEITVVREGVETSIYLQNTDTMLEGYEGTFAAKTGYTLAAGPCVATAVNRDDGREYYAVVLNSSSKQQRFEDSRALYDWAFEHVDAIDAVPTEREDAQALPETSVPLEAQTKCYQLISARFSVHTSFGGVEDDYPVIAKVAHDDWKNRTVAATVLEPHITVTLPDETGHIYQEVSLQDVTGDVRKGDVIGHLTFRWNDEIVKDVDVVALEDVAAPTWWESIGVALDRAFGSLFGEPQIAETEFLALGAVRIS